MPESNKVLVIDDNPLINRLVKKALQETEFEVVGYAENGYKGIDLFKELTPDIVTLDVTMPGLNGVDTLKGLQAIDPNVKVIILTSTNYGKVIDDLHEMGVQQVVLKPFTSDVILESLRKLCIT